MKRLLSLDVMRGITIAGMILVNNPGSWGSIYAPLEHAQWHGLTPTDLVFPFFMFVMGVSTFLSLRKYGFSPSMSAVVKILRRSLLLLLIGWAIAWFGRAWSGLCDPDKSWIDAINNFDQLRIPGVFQRLGVCYCITALLAITVSRRCMGWIAAGVLLLYAVLLLLFNGLAFSDSNIIAVVDRAVFGEAHMYSDTIDGLTLKFDPEGLLSTLPSVAHCIIGFLCGAMLSKAPDRQTGSYKLFIVGFVLAFAGFLFSYGIPVNKKIWSPTFVFTTCGLASSMLALLIYIIDMRGWQRWSTFFKVFGVNALALYVFSTLLAISLDRIKVVVDGAANLKLSLKQLIYQKFLLPLCGDDTMLASLIFALLFVLTCWGVGYLLYRKKIYIKV